MEDDIRELYQEVILDHGKNPRNFGRPDDATAEADGNNPLCGRLVIFKLEILNIRDATVEEIEAGGAIIDEPEVDGTIKVPI